MNATEFLTALWTDQPPGQIQLWTLGDKRSTFTTDPRAAANFEGRADAFHAIGTVRAPLSAGQRGKVDQICAVAGLYCDFDADRNGKGRGSECGFQAQPTIVVDSGHGLHAYWLFTEGPWIFRTLEDRAACADLQRRWVALHPAADRAASDIARVLRLPGTINDKDPADPRPVRVISSDGPRHRVVDLTEMVSHIIPPTGFLNVVNGERPTGGMASPVDPNGDRSSFARKLDALRSLSPEFEEAWGHTSAALVRAGAVAQLGWSLSEWDLALCSLAAGAMTDPELAALIDAHRTRWGNGNDIMKGHRQDYLERTIAKARTTGVRR